MVPRPFFVSCSARLLPGRAVLKPIIRAGSIIRTAQKGARLAVSWRARVNAAEECSGLQEVTFEEASTGYAVMCAMLN